MPRLSKRVPGAALIAAVLAVCVISCATSGPWQPAPQRLVGAVWSVDIPLGWMRLHTPDYEMFSKDGPYLHYILIQDRPLDHGFRFTQRKLEAHMLPHEAARVVVAGLSADPKIKNFTLHDSAPATLDQVLGFKLDYAYTDPQGVKIQAIYYGAIINGRFFNLRYTAAERHYYGKYLAAFDQVRRSLQLGSPS